MSLIAAPEYYFDVLKKVKWVQDPEVGRKLPKNATKKQQIAFAEYKKMVENAQKNMCIVVED